MESNEEEEQDAYFHISNDDINNMNDEMRQLREDNDVQQITNEDEYEQDDDDTSVQITTSIYRQLPPAVQKTSLLRQK